MRHWLCESRISKAVRDARSPKGAGLPGLSTEFIIPILGAMDTPTLHCAGVATPIFNNIRGAHTTVISSSILSKTIKCYPSAFQLEREIRPCVPNGDYILIIRAHQRIYVASTAVNEAHAQYVLDFGINYLSWSNYVETPKKSTSLHVRFLLVLQIYLWYHRPTERA